ncbi:hypothetical protein [Hyphobacterium sp.]|jgi:hypothetical protein|uniref:hypothetical protein n=1 Tax=Hyphobacterium sp. TaxID=2004662 RepID=UPI003BAD48BD
MPAWIETLNFLSARLRRAVFVLLALAALQAIPGALAVNDGAGDLHSDSLTLRRAID